MREQRRSAVRAVAAGFGLLLLPACSVPGPGPGPGPTAPSATAPSSSARATTTQPTPPETSIEREQRLAFEAAEKSYRAFIAETDRIGNAGGANSASARMRELAAGPYLQFYVRELRLERQQHARYTGNTRIGYVQRGGYSQRQLTLRVCEDGSSTRVLDKNGKQISEGQLLRRQLYVRQLAGRWKIWDGDEEGSTTSCHL